MIRVKGVFAAAAVLLLPVLSFAEDYPHYAKALDSYNQQIYVGAIGEAKAQLQDTPSHAPSWILIDDTLRSLDGETLERFMDTLAHELVHTGVIHIGAGQARNPLFSRTLHLVKAPAAHVVGRDDSASVTASSPAS